MSDYKDLNDYEIMYMISENDEYATNLLFMKYKPLIIKLANEYYKKGKNYGLELDDFIQEGSYALFCAIKHYDYNKNILFYSYALICIKSKMQNLIARNTTRKNMILNDSVSLYDSVSDTSLSLIDVIADKNAKLPEEECIDIELENGIKKLLYDLKFDESIICELRLNGFTHKDIMSLLQISVRTLDRVLAKFKKNLAILIEKNNI